MVSLFIFSGVVSADELGPGGSLTLPGGSAPTGGSGDIPYWQTNLDPEETILISGTENTDTGTDINVILEGDVEGVTLTSGSTDSDEETGYIACSGTNCDLNAFMATVTNVMSNIYILSFSVATLLFIYAGFLLMSSGDDVSKRARAKGIFKNVIIGFIIMFLSYFFIWTLLKSLGVEADFLFFLTG